MVSKRRKLDFPGKPFAVDGHDIYLLTNDEERLSAIIANIESATDSIRMLTYMFRDDESGREILDMLVAAARRGISVTLMIDSFGSKDTEDDFFAPLLAAGGEYHRFGSRWNLGYFIRNHQKILIADGEHIVLGGFNITDKYFGRAGAESWEDFGMILSGHATKKLCEYYDQLVAMSCDGGIEYSKLSPLISNWQPDDGKVQLLLGGPTNRISPWALSLKNDLEDARHLDIASAYFSPSQSILRRIAAVGGRGRSRLVLAGKTDNHATIGAARLVYKYLLKRGTQIFEYRPRPLHMKLLIIDNACYIGSSNLDIRSLFINIEIMARIEDEALAEYLRAFIGDMAENSEQQTLILHRGRSGIFKRIWWFCNYVMVNLLDYTIGRRIKFRLLGK